MPSWEQTADDNTMRRKSLNVEREREQKDYAQVLSYLLDAPFPVVKVHPASFHKKF